MKRKINITSRTVKKTVLWALLAVLVVGLGIIIVQSFGKDNILSNNTSLNEIEYSGDYGNYLENQLITNRLNKAYKSDIDSAKETYESSVSSYENKAAADIVVKQQETAAKIVEIMANTETSDEEKLELIEEAEFKLELDTLAIKTELESQIKELKNTYNSTLESIELKAKNDIFNNKTLSEVIKDPENTPLSFGYATSENTNKAIKAVFNATKTAELNADLNGNAKNDSGQIFTIGDGTKPYVYSGREGSVVYDVTVTESGYYNILLDYIPFTSVELLDAKGINTTEESGGSPIERIIKINDEVLFDDLANVSFLRTWSDDPEGEKFIDAAQNEIKPRQVEVPRDVQQYVRDSVGYVTEPYLVYFEANETTQITIESIRENMGISNVFITSRENYETYDEYKQSHSDKEVINGQIAYHVQGEGGESLQYKGEEVVGTFYSTVIRSSSTIYGISDRTSAYNSMIVDGQEAESSPVRIVLNSIGGSKWSTPGDWIQWDVEVEKAGLYQISLRAKQNISRGLFSTRKLSIDGQVPFAEAMNCKFVYGSSWSVVTLGGQVGDSEEGYYFYLDEGKHTITLECTLGDYASQIARVQAVIDDLNGLYRKIIQKTSINPDPYMDYFKNQSGKKLLEEADKIFAQSIEILKDVSEKITEISGEKSSETASLETMAIQLQQFIDDHSKIQKNLSDFSTNISSLGTWILNVSQQSLTIDYLMVHTADYELPKANPNFFVSSWFSIRGFFGSFFFDYESVGLNAENEGWNSIDVWLCTSESQGREQANAISAMISEACKDKNSILYGINVKLKVVSSDVLLTATLANRGPDVAINLGNGTPVNYALRGATRDLTQFTEENISNYFEASKAAKISSFQEIALAEVTEMHGGTRRFQHSAMTPYEFNGGYYALPYTQSFLVMFYRTDMFEENGWDIPRTWTDVIQLIPELQIMNFQFYLPLNTVGASSVVNQIFASKLYQTVESTNEAFYRTSINEFGEEFIESNFDSEEAQQAFEFWCSFYTDYKFPLSASFVNRFRSGETPIGIAGYDMYNTLAVSAPEIRGKWDFGLLPGTEKVDENGNKYIDNTGAASGMSLIMMETTENPYEAWAFMDWFTSADVQVSYAREIEAILGAAARHNTANVAAFNRLAWTEKEKEVLMNQWEQTVGVPEVAGGYYTGRNLENAFREVVNNNLNPRQILSDYILTINSEIDRKREEFGLASSTTKSKGE